MLQETVLITGAAGFIGYHLAQRMLRDGYEVIGIDNMNDYYDITLKQSRMHELEHERLKFYQESVEHTEAMDRVIKIHKPSMVIHLAAQAGVGSSANYIKRYVDSNLVGFVSVLEASKNHGVEKVIYASSSSVYGANTKLPNSVHDSISHPLSLYAATKKANELIAHSYSHLYGMSTIGLRFFNAYGPWGRPDMALFIFTKAILKREPVNIYNYGHSQRDFTYIDDIIECICRLSRSKVQPDSEWKEGLIPDPATSYAPYKLYNIGNRTPVTISDMIKMLEQELGETAIKRFLPANTYDVPATCADTDLLFADIQYTPDTSMKKGIHHFVDWYQQYYRTNKMLVK